MIDQILSTDTSWWLFFAGTILFFLLTVEGFFWYGRWRRGRVESEQKHQAGTVLSALLVLLGFLLGVSFNIANDLYVKRKRLVLEEANDIGTTFLRTDFLAEPQRTDAKKLLAEYVEVRLQPLERGEGTKKEIVEAGIDRSAQIHARLWEIAGIASAQSPRSVPVGSFVDSLNTLIDRHEERVMVSIHYRVPSSLLWTLYLVTFLSMVNLGIYSGLSGTRNLIVTVALVIAFATVLLLIVDLDQVRQRLFTVSQSPMTDTQTAIRESMSSSTAIGGGPKESDAPSPETPSKGSP